MGMWDCTCGVSNLPIKHGDAIRLFILRERVFGENFSWVPVTVPFAGTYDNYGGIERVHTSNVTRFQLEVLAKVAEPIPSDELRGYPKLAKFPTTAQSVVRACERGLLRLNLVQDTDEQSRAAVRTGIFMVREKVYQAMISVPGIGVSRPRVKRWLDQPRSPVESLRALYSEGGTPYLAPLTLSSIRDLSEEGIDLLAQGPVWAMEAPSYRTLSDFTDADWALLKTEFLDATVFVTTLRTELRRRLHPAMHTDQHDGAMGYDAHRMLATLTLKWCDEMESDDKRRWEDPHA